MPVTLFEFHNPYQAGYQANEGGALREANPFLDYGPYAQHLSVKWFAGWDAFQPIRDEFEAELAERAHEAYLADREDGLNQILDADGVQ